MANDPIIYVADAGSVSGGNYHWVCSRNISDRSPDPLTLAKNIANDLRDGRRVALGYESPLFVPCDVDACSLGRARNGECQEETGNRPFTAGAGATVFATGVQSLAWVLRKVREFNHNASATTRWKEFLDTNRIQLFVFEAFVSGSEKAFPPSHAEDAALAIQALKTAIESEVNPTCIKCSDAFSLGGAAILYANLSSDVRLLSEPCVVLRPLFSPEESRARLESYKQRRLAAAELKRLKKGGGTQIEH